MNILRSNDVKRINKNVIRKSLLELRSATRKELMEATGISSSSIGSLIMEMVKDCDIVEESIDSSTGGRCPMRYVLNYEIYRVMCILVDREYADIYILDSLYHTIYRESISMKDHVVLKEHIKALSIQYHVLSIHVSTPGIINDDYTVVMDYEDGFWDMELYKNLYTETKLPMYMNNDVKCMAQGYYKDKELRANNLAYVYLSSEGGLGCAVMAEGVIINGENHLAGEIGLLEYGGRSMNNLLREHPNDHDTIAILSRLVAILVCCVNPSLIILSGVKHEYEIELQHQVERIVSDRFTINFAFDDDNNYHILKALWTHGMDELMSTGKES